MEGYAPQTYPSTALFQRESVNPHWLSPGRRRYSGRRPVHENRPASWLDFAGYRGFFFEDGCGGGDAVAFVEAQQSHTLRGATGFANFG